MAIMDLQNLFSNAQAITATAVSTNVIDLGAAGAAQGTNLQVNATCVEAFNNLTTLTTTMETATDEAFTTPITIATAVVKTLANAPDLTAGDALHFGNVPPNALRYIRLKYTVVGSAPSTGKITAGLVAGRK